MLVIYDIFSYFIPGEPLFLMVAITTIIKVSGDFFISFYFDSA